MGPRLLAEPLPRSQKPGATAQAQGKEGTTDILVSLSEFKLMAEQSFPPNLPQLLAFTPECCSPPAWGLWMGRWHRPL